MPRQPTPDHLAAYVRAMSERIGGVIRSANIKAE